MLVVRHAATLPVERQFVRWKIQVLLDSRGPLCSRRIELAASRFSLRKLCSMHSFSLARITPERSLVLQESQSSLACLIAFMSNISHQHVHRFIPITRYEFV
jgi:hypothetical protein